MNTVPYPIPKDHDKLAEKIYEFICANTPEKTGKGLHYPWPHGPFSGLNEEAKDHYRLAAIYCKIASSDGIREIAGLNGGRAVVIEGGEITGMAG